MICEHGRTAVTEWRRGLLVSVRDAAEAEIVAEAGVSVTDITGVSVIDIKEPRHGPLGRALADVSAEAIIAVAGRAAVTLACGELTDGPAVIAAHVADVIAAAGQATRLIAVKAGPAGLLDTLAWSKAFRQVVKLIPDSLEAVAVAYADWRAALSPPPDAIIAAAAAAGARTVLVDTFDKAGPGLFGVASQADVAMWTAQARKAGLAIALAGKLTSAEVLLAFELGGNIAGVRSAVCSDGRLGEIDRTRVFSVGKLVRREGRARAHILEGESIS